MSAPARTGARLAASSIAWGNDPGEDDAIAAILRDGGCAGVELALTKWRDEPTTASPAQVSALRRAWSDRGLEIVSLQSLLFGHDELRLFGDAATRRATLDYLRRMADLAALLGAGRLVFGSPRNRLRGALSMERALGEAADFFSTLADHAEVRGVCFAIEANPVAYGGDFLLGTADVAALCRSVNRASVQLNADVGGMALAGEDPASSIALAARLVAHVHASEPRLAELGGPNGESERQGRPDESTRADRADHADHASAARALAAIDYADWISIEMRAAGDAQRNAAAVARAVRRAKTLYAPALAAPQ